MYKITINKNRDATFIAKYFNFSDVYSDKIEGKFQTRINEKDFNNIINLLNNMDFPNLQDVYHKNICDLPGCTLTIIYNNGKKKIIEDNTQEGTRKLRKLYSLFDKLRFNQKWEKQS